MGPYVVGKSRSSVIVVSFERAAVRCERVVCVRSRNARGLRADGKKNQDGAAGCAFGDNGCRWV